MRRSVMATTVAVVWITAFGVIDLTFSNVDFFGTLTLAAVGVSLFAPARMAAFVWIYAFIWNAFLGVDGAHWSGLHFLRLSLSFLVGGGSVFIALVRERREHTLEVVTDVALAAQRALLREVPERVDGAKVAARYISAAEEALVGGDFFEVVSTPYGLRAIVGDVVGRGLDAVGLAGLVLGGFREAALSAPDLRELVHRLDDTVKAYGSGDDYATGLLIELRGRELCLVSSGHPFPYLLDGPEHPPLLLELPTNLPLGFGSDPEMTLRTLRDDERLLVYTDGISEGRDGSGRFFDLALDGAEALRERDPDVTLDGLITALEEHVGGSLKDDVALLLIEPAHP